MYRSGYGLLGSAMVKIDTDEDDGDAWDMYHDWYSEQYAETEEADKKKDEDFCIVCNNNGGVLGPCQGCGKEVRYGK